MDECEKAYLNMENVLIDDRRIHVDFCQSIATHKWNKSSIFFVHKLFCMSSFDGVDCCIIMRIFLIDPISLEFRVIIDVLTTLQDLKKSHFIIASIKPLCSFMVLDCPVV